MKTFFSPTETGINLNIRLSPGAGANRVEGVQPNADGEAVLKCAVTQIAEGGKANKALIAMLAKEWKLAKSCFEVRRGTTSRNKVLAVSGDADELMGLLTRWADQRSE